MMITNMRWRAEKRTQADIDGIFENFWETRANALIKKGW